MSEQRETPKRKSAATWKGYALVVAVSKYDNINGLPAAVLNDANDLASVLASPIHCGYPSANMRVLLDADASLSNIQGALEWLASVAGPDDSVIVFFSGHGTRLSGSGSIESALLPVDTELARLRETSLPEGELSSALKAIRSARLLVLLDACHSGGSVSLKGMDTPEVMEAGFDEKSLAHLAEGVGRVVIASSRSTETSLVFTGARNSVFTQHLLEAFRGETSTSGDGAVRVFDVFQHVSVKVPQTTSDRQHPIFKASDLETNFPVSLDKGGRKSLVGAATEHSKDNFDWNELEEILSDLYPTGPIDQDIWRRAGGDLARLRLNQSGRASWFASLLILKQGGGGNLLSRRSLVQAALQDFPNQGRLKALLGSLTE
jgi:hypothetical protein